MRFHRVSVKYFKYKKCLLPDTLSHKQIINLLKSRAAVI